MSSSEEWQSTCPDNKFRGIRRRKWGKWVSEIRVPGTQDRLWLGSYSSPEAAAVAHDIASYCLRGAAAVEKLNFPHLLPAGLRGGMSPRSIQLSASDAGMAVDAQLKINNNSNPHMGHVSRSGVAAGESSNRDQVSDESCSSRRGGNLSVSIDDYV